MTLGMCRMGLTPALPNVGLMRQEQHVKGDKWPRGTALHSHGATPRGTLGSQPLPRIAALPLHTHLPGASWSPSTMPEVTLLHSSTGGPRLPGASRP